LVDAGFFEAVQGAHSQFFSTAHVPPLNQARLCQRWTRNCTQSGSCTTTRSPQACCDNRFPTTKTQRTLFVHSHTRFVSFSLRRTFLSCPACTGLQQPHQSVVYLVVHRESVLSPMRGSLATYLADTRVGTWWYQHAWRQSTDR
jgi:hypothetical protein